MAAASAKYALWIVSVCHLHISSTAGNKTVLDLHAIRNTKHAPTQVAAEVLAPLAVRWRRWLEFHLSNTNSGSPTANCALWTLCVCHLPNGRRGGTKTIRLPAIRTTKHPPTTVGAACPFVANGCCGGAWNACASATPIQKQSSDTQGNASDDGL